MSLKPARHSFCLGIHIVRQATFQALLLIYKKVNPFALLGAGALVAGSWMIKLLDII